MSTFVTSVKVKLTLSNQNYSLRKYKILQLIDSQPLMVAKNLMKLLPAKLGISRQTFSNYLNASIDSPLQIPSDSLLVLALLFDTSPFDLLNYNIQHISISWFVPSSCSSAIPSTDLTV